MTERALRKWIVAICVAAATLASPATAAARGGQLQISSRTMQLGGKLTLNVDAVIPEGGGGQSGFQLEISPHIGVFVTEGLELLFSTAIVVPFGELYEDVPKRIGLFFGLRYVFDLGGLVLPYLGIAFGPELTVPARSNTQTFLGFNLPMGILIALNRHVAINVGVAPAFAFGVAEVQATIVRIPMGFLGVDAFF